MKYHTFKKKKKKKKKKKQKNKNLLKKTNQIKYIKKKKKKKKKKQQKNQILLKYLFHEFFTFNGFMELSVDILK